MKVFDFTSTKQLFATLAVISICVIHTIPMTAYSAFIQPDTALASTEFTGGFDGRALHTIDGSGLPTGFGPSDAHAAYQNANHWTTASGTAPADQFIIWGFATARILDAAYIWNHQSTVPIASNSGYDVTLFDLTLFDSTNTVLLTLNDVSLTPDVTTGQAFLFGASVAGVRSVRFDVEAVQGSPDFTGLAEVGFNVIPEPSVWAICAIVATLTPGLLRRRSPRPA